MSSSKAFRIGSIAAFFQLLVIITYGIITVSLGERPSGVREIFEAFQQKPVSAFLAMSGFPNHKFP
jgi:hypothetical protein